MAFNFNYFSPTHVYFGKGTHTMAGELCKKEGAKKVLVHYGGQSAIKTGVLKAVSDSLESVGLPYVTLGGVVPNPHLELVYEGIKLCKDENVDFILAIGGGSVIDSAKAIAYGLAYDGDVWDLYMGKAKATACYPVGAVLTISAAGSETSNSSVITYDKEKLKRSYNDNLARPKFAIMNPELTVTLPDYQTESGCTDIMMHTMERYFTNGGNMDITDAIAEGLLRNVMKYAEILHTDPQNYEARAEIMWCGSLAHNDLTGCGNDGGDFASHMLEHEMGGMFDVTHGAGLAAIWPSWARYVYKDCLHRFVKYAVNVMGVTPESDDIKTAEKGIRAMEEFYHRIGMPINMKELGIEPTDEQIHEMAVLAAQACGGHKGSAKVLYQDDMEAIYKMAR